MKKPILITAGIAIFLCALVAGGLIFINYTAPSSTGSDVTNPPLSQTDEVRPTSVHPSDKITSPVIVSGDAKQDWYAKDGSFPIEIHDVQGNVVGQAIAHRLSASSTMEYVPFNASVTFKVPKQGLVGTVVLMRGVSKGNAQQDTYTVPVTF
jgi:hypothetical protein